MTEGEGQRAQMSLDKAQAVRALLGNMTIKFAAFFH
jgi:hypothetical protein